MAKENEYGWWDAGFDVWLDSNLKAAEWGTTGYEVGGGIGGIVGTVAGGLYGIYTGNKAARDKQELIGEQKDFETLQKTRTKEAISANSEAIYGFKPRGTTLGGYYKMGGRLKDIKGGGLRGVSSTGRLVTGNRHEQGGINLGNAEVEGGEFIDGKNVFTDRLFTRNNKTFADEALAISKKKGKLEEGMIKSVKDRNKYRYNAINRLRSIADNELKQLFEEQEGLKEQSGIEGSNQKFAVGGNLDNNPYNREAYYRYDYSNNPFISDPYDRYNMGIQEGKPNMDIIDINNKRFLSNPQNHPYIRNPKPEMIISPSTNGAYKRDINTTIPQLSQPSNINYKRTDERGDFNPNAFSRASAIGTDMGGKAKSYLANNINSESISELAPLVIDNLQAIQANRRLKGLKIPKPTYLTPAVIDKRVDINASLSEIEAGKSGMFRNIDSNTANSQTALAMKSKVDRAARLDKSKLHQEKTNVERQLSNQEIAMNKSIEEKNNALYDDYKASEFAKDVQTKITNPSANSINLVDDIKYLMDKNDLKEHQMAAIVANSIASSEKKLGANFLPIFKTSSAKLEYSKGAITSNDEYIDFYKKLKGTLTSRDLKEFKKWGNEQGYTIK